VKAIIAGDESFKSGPIPIALAHAGFEVCECKDPSDAADRIGEHRPCECMLVLDAGSLESDDPRWGRLLGDHERVAAVVVSLGGASPEARTLAQVPHRVLLEAPFDAAAVVAAAIRAAATARHRIHRVASSVPGSKYAS
jgi:hypothetical protein